MTRIAQKKLAHNNMPHNHHFPIKLELDGKWVGCYESRGKALEIAKAAIAAGDAAQAVMRDLQDGIVDQIEKITTGCSAGIN